MSVAKLITLIKNAQTMQEAFNNLRGMEIMQGDMGSSYVPVEARKEFVILEDNGGDRTQFLHPYGSLVTYEVRGRVPDMGVAPAS